MLDKLINEELERANKKFPPFQILHEAWAVTLEEVQELEREVELLRFFMEDYWRLCKDSKNTTNKQIEKMLNNLDTTIISAFEELIQIAAMVKKARGLMKFGQT